MASKKSEAACKKAYVAECKRRQLVQTELNAAIRASGRVVSTDGLFSFVSTDEKNYPVTTELTVNLIFPASEDASIVTTSITLARYAEVASQVTSLLKEIPTLQSEYGKVSLSEMKVGNTNRSFMLGSEPRYSVWVQFTARHAVSKDEV